MKFTAMEVAAVVPPLPYGPPVPATAGFVTVTGTVPEVAMAEAGMSAVSCLAVTNVVVKFVPFHFTIEPDAKLVPLTVIMNAGPPAFVLSGDNSAITGTTPGWGVAGVEGELYPPHPKQTAISRKTHIIFIVVSRCPNRNVSTPWRQVVFGVPFSCNKNVSSRRRMSTRRGNATVRPLLAAANFLVCEETGRGGRLLATTPFPAFPPESSFLVAPRPHLPRGHEVIQKILVTVQ